MLEMTFVRPIAKGLVLGHTATADTHDLPSCQPIWRSIAIYDLEIPFDFQRTIAIDGNLGSGHFRTFLARNIGCENQRFPIFIELIPTLVEMFSPFFERMVA